MSILETIKKWLLDQEDPEVPDQPDNQDEKDQIDFQKEENFENVDAVVLISKPKSFKDAQALCRHIKKGRAIMINLDDMIPEEKQRLVDFISGVVMAQDGMIAKIHNNAYVCAARNIGIINIDRKQ